MMPRHLTPYQVATLVPTTNLFLDPEESEFVKPRRWTGGQIDARVHAGIAEDQFNYDPNYFDGATESLAGRGLYGDYRLIIPVEAINAGFVPDSHQRHYAALRLLLDREHGDRIER